MCTSMLSIPLWSLLSFFSTRTLTLLERIAVSEFSGLSASNTTTLIFVHWHCESSSAEVHGCWRDCVLSVIACGYVHGHWVFGPALCMSALWGRGLGASILCGFLFGKPNVVDKGRDGARQIYSFTRFPAEDIKMLQHRPMSDVRTMLRT